VGGQTARLAVSRGPCRDGERRSLWNSVKLAKTEGICVRSVDYSETSQVVTFLTRDFGKITALAKGSKRRGNRFDGPIDLLTLSRIMFIDKSHKPGDGGGPMELCDDFRGLRKEIETLRCAGQLTEIVNRIVPEGQPAPQLFGATLESLGALASGCVHRDMALGYFEARAVRALGYMPRTSVCAVCDTVVGKTEGVAFSARHGGPLCRNCRGAETHYVETTLGALALLEKLSSLRFEMLPRLKPSRAMLGDMLGVLAFYLASIAERKIAGSWPA
jgi:DNA repair protein RecO (recombination protein O)